MASVIRALLLLLASLFVAAADPMPVEEFKEKAVPLVRRFIFLKYERFRASELTFRHLKQVRAPPKSLLLRCPSVYSSVAALLCAVSTQHLADKLGMTYEQLKADEYSSVVEDTTDEIANECNMGEVAIEECKKRIGYVDAEAAKDEI